MKKIKLVLKATLFCLASALSMGLAQAGPYGPWLNDNAPFGTNGNVINNWSFERPNIAKIQSGFDTVPYWFSRATSADTGIEGGSPPNVAEAAYDGLWGAFLYEQEHIHAMQTTSYIIQRSDCFLVSVASKAVFTHTASWGPADGYLSVVLYYGGTPNVVSGNVNTTLGTMGTPFFTNVIHVVQATDGSHINQLDYTNYFFGVITNSIPDAATNHVLGIDITQVTTNFNPNADSTKDWLSFDGVVVIPTNGIPPIAAPVALTPTNSVWGGDTLTFTEIAFGSTPLAYQWQTDGGGGGALNDMDGETASNLVVVASTTSGTYKYQVIITNNAGSCTSAVMSYVVRGLAAPAITQDTGTADWGPITNLFAFIGGNVNLYASSDGAPVVTNRWMVMLDSGGGYTNIVGATNFWRTLTNVQSSSQGYYMLGATNAFGSAWTQQVTVVGYIKSPAMSNEYALVESVKLGKLDYSFERSTDTAARGCRPRRPH